MNKMDEKILVFPFCAKKGLVGFPGYVPVNTTNYDWFVSKIFDRLFFMRRGDVEDDVATQQLIPYVVVQDSSGRILVYNRGNKGGEERLARKWSIGVGGHLNIDDAVDKSNSWDSAGWWAVIHSGARRELQEELSGMENVGVFQLLGFLDINITPVDEVHFGIVFKVVCDDPAQVKPTGEIEELRWVTREELKDYKLENWSELIRRKLFD